MELYAVISVFTSVFGKSCKVHFGTGVLCSELISIRQLQVGVRSSRMASTVATRQTINTNTMGFDTLGRGCNGFDDGSSVGPSMGTSS